MGLDGHTVVVTSTTALIMIAILLLAPQPPENVNASTINSTAVKISWDKPNITNGIIRYYLVVYGRNGSMDRMELNSTIVTAVMSRLNPFTTYVFHVIAVTVAQSNPSENVTALTAQAGNI